MSAVRRQRTCATCGGPFVDGEYTDLEPLIDGAIRYVAVHHEHSTFAPLRKRREHAVHAPGGTSLADAA